MKRLGTLIAMLGLVAALAAGCSTYRPPSASLPPPGSGGEYTGEPTRLVVRVLGGAARSPVRWLLPLAHAGDSLDAVIRIANYRDGVRIYEHFETKPYSLTSGAAVEVEVPAQMGYEVSAVVHGSGLKRLGLVSSVHAPADTTTVVEVPVEPPTFDLTAPSIVYEGGTVTQFHAWSDHPMYSGNTDVFIGTREWQQNDVDGFWNVNDPKRGGWGAIVLGGGGVVGAKSFPAAETETTLYYQVRVCVKPSYADGNTYCYYAPDVEAGEPLWTATLRAGPPQ